MAGLIFFSTLALCLWGCVRLAGALGNLVPNPAWSRKVQVGTLMALLASPFADEVVGKYQFEALCKANGIESVDVSRARGKRAKVHYGERHLVAGTMVPIQVDDVTFRDADSGGTLFHYKDYHATGGWLMRYTPMNMGDSSPMLFDGNGCGSKRREEIFYANQIFMVN